MSDEGLHLIAAPRAGRRLGRDLNITAALGGHRVGPVVREVQLIAETVERLLITWRCDVQALLRGEPHARGGEVQLDALLMRMAHPEHGVFVRL